jgi:putative ABC transport system substrate-binding protein
MRRIGVLYANAANERDAHDNMAALKEELTKLGWLEGGNLRSEIRYAAGDASRLRASASELVKLAPDVIVTVSQAAAVAVQQQTKTIPIVAAGLGPLENQDLIRNIARPEGNLTGFPVLYGSIGSKWLELLKEVAPQVAKVASIFNPVIPTISHPATVFSPPIEAAARALGVSAVHIPFGNAAELDRALDSFAAEANVGLIVIPSAATGTRESRQALLLKAAAHRTPVIHWDKAYPADGGLMSYGSDFGDIHRRAATYVDRILRGAKISELPVQYPTKFDLVVNLKAAKAIGLTIPESFLVRADEVFE